MDTNVAACTFANRDTYCKVLYYHVSGYMYSILITCGKANCLVVVPVRLFTGILCVYMCFHLKGGVDVLSTCVGVASSLTAAEVAMLTNAWAELLTPASVNDDTVSYCYFSTMLYDMVS